METRPQNRIKILLLIVLTTSLLPAKEPKFGHLAKEGKTKDAHVIKGGLHANTTFYKLDFDELNKEKERFIKEGKKETATRYLERMLIKGQELDYAKLQAARLELANLYLELGLDKKAEKHFEQYSKLYPKSPQAEFAQFKTIECKYNTTLEPDRDQTKTGQALQLCEQYLDNKSYTAHRSQVDQMRNKLLDKMVQHEQSVFHYYVKKGSIAAARKRIDYVKNQLLPKYAGAQAAIDAMQAALNENGSHEPK